MTGYLTHNANLARLEEMRARAAERRSAGGAKSTREETDPRAPESIDIRHATGADLVALARLATIDSAEAPTGEVLLAEVGGELRAAIEIATGATIADPFRRTADVVELLSLSAARLREGTESPRRQRLRPWSPRALRERQRMPSSP